MKITFEKAIDLLRKEKWHTQRPKFNRGLPVYMKEWSELKINAYYTKMQEKGDVYEFAITVLQNIYKLKQVSYELSKIFDEINFDQNDNEQ